jgi:hypothetical protein
LPGFDDFGKGSGLLAHNWNRLEEAHRTMLEGIETCRQFDLIRGLGLGYVHQGFSHLRRAGLGLMVGVEFRTNESLRWAFLP